MSPQEIIGTLITLTAVASYINYKFVKLPKSIGITLVTLTLSLIFVLTGRFGVNVDHYSQLLLQGIGFNETFLHGMLSFLLFAGSLHVNVMELAKHKTLVALLATVSVAVSTILVGYATYALSQFLGLNIPVTYCLVFGALISPTDPIAVLGILKTANAPKSLEMKIAGEALFNDGMGIVLFVVIMGIASGTQVDRSALDIGLFFVQQGGGGILLGLCMGYLTSNLLKKVDDYGVAIMVTLAIVTGGYTLAHSVAHVSGPICMAVAGLIIGNSIKKGVMSKETVEQLDAFWELIDEILNAILFVLIGLEFLNLTYSLSTTLAAIGTIGITIAARWISVMVPVGCLSMFRKFSANVVMIMTWGGLRGGISIALALSIAPGPIRDYIVVITYAVVMFSMMVQGLTIGPLVRKICALPAEQSSYIAENQNKQRQLAME